MAHKKRRVINYTVTLLLVATAIAGSSTILLGPIRETTLEQLKVARTMAAECYPEDYTCAEMVGNSLQWRKKYAEYRLQRKVTYTELIGTRLQYSGVDHGAKVHSIMEAMTSTFDFLRIAKNVINGEVSNDFFPSVLYARCDTYPDTAWGRRALRNNVIVRFADGHCAVVIRNDGEGSYFRLP